MTENKTHGNCIHSKVLMGSYPCDSDLRTSPYLAEGCPFWAPKPEPPKPKGVDILMTCGEEHFIETDQPTIKTVRVNGVQVYPSNDVSSPITGRQSGINNEKVAQLLTKITGEYWVFDASADYQEDGSISEMTQNDLKSGNIHAIFPFSGNRYIRLRRG